MKELIRAMMRQDLGDQCRVVSPDGVYNCIIRKGHEGDCQNTFVNVSWCGWCPAWTCRKPETHAEKIS